MPSPARVGIGEPHTSRRAPEADAEIEVDYSKTRTDPLALSLLEAGRGTL